MEEGTIIFLTWTHFLELKVLPLMP